MRRPLAFFVVVTLSLGLAQVASAELLQGSAKLGRTGCAIHLVSATRVDRAADRRRYVRVVANLVCKSAWDRAHISLRVLNDQAAFDSRDFVSKNYRTGVKSGTTTMAEKMTCNRRKNGEWVYDRGLIDFSAWAEVHSGTQGNNARVTDSATTVHC